MVWPDGSDPIGRCVRLDEKAPWLTIAIGAGRLLSSLLFGVPPYDALILTFAVAALGAGGFLATWLPARRASRVDR